jgi:hypothetical protein
MRILFFLAATFALSGVAAHEYLFKLGESGPWHSWMPLHKTADGVEMRLPGRLDPNHLDGIGPLWLLSHMNVTDVRAPGTMDLDGAELTVALRGKDIRLRDGKLMWWIADQIPAEFADPRLPWQQTNWALTCCIINLGDGTSDWTTYTVKLHSDPGDWTYGGSNVMMHGDWGRRYREYPIEKVLTPAFGGTLHLAIVGGRADTPPTGSIEIREISIRTKEAAQPIGIDAIGQLMTSGSWEAVRWHLERLVDVGDENASYHYGRLLKLGLGGPVDLAEAARHLLRAKAMPQARLELAELYFYGLGVARDPAKGIALLESPGVRTYPQARYLLGLARDSGIGTQRDIRRSLEDFRFAAHRGHVHAMHSLARRLKDPSEAYFWFRLAATRLDRASSGGVVDMVDADFTEAKRRLAPGRQIALDRAAAAWKPIVD